MRAGPSPYSSQPSHNRDAESLITPAPWGHSWEAGQAAGVCTGDCQSHSHLTATPAFYTERNVLGLPIPQGVERQKEDKTPV